MNDDFDFRRKKKDQVSVRNPFLGGPQQVEGNFQAMSCILTLLLRLRQAAVHLALIKEVNFNDYCNDIFLGIRFRRIS